MPSRSTRGPVTVAQFARFIGATGYLTLAERPPDPASYPDADPALLREGSVVFHPTPGPVPLHDPSRWSAYVHGAHWRLIPLRRSEGAPTPRAQLSLGD